MAIKWNLRVRLSWWLEDVVWKLHLVTNRLRVNQQLKQLNGSH